MRASPESMGDVVAPELPLESDALEQLAARIRSTEAVVAIVGLGYVGPPLLAAVGQAGFRAFGVDQDEAKIRSLQAGHSVVVDVTDATVRSLGDASFGDSIELVADADVIVMCLPTPLRDGVPDVSMITDAAEAIGPSLRPGVLVVLESTSYPGTTEDLLRPILEKASGLSAGRDFALA